MKVTFTPGSPGEYAEGVDRHFYANQVVSRGPLDTTYAFRKAAAHAKDRARHNQIRAIRKEEVRVRQASLTGIGDYSAQARQNVLANRTVDGVKGAKDDAIKL